MRAKAGTPELWAPRSSVVEGGEFDHGQKIDWRLPVAGSFFAHRRPLLGVGYRALLLEGALTK